MRTGAAQGLDDMLIIPETILRSLCRSNKGPTIKAGPGTSEHLEADGCSLGSIGGVEGKA